MKSLQSIHKFYGVLVLVLFSLLVILKVVPGSAILNLAFFIALSTVPLFLLALIKKRLRKPILHWVLIVLMWLAAATVLDDIHLYDHPVLVIFVAILPSMYLITDLILSSEIGRPPRKRFRALVQIAQAEVALSLIALLILGLFYDAAERLGSTQFSLMLMALVGMLYSMSTTERARDPIRVVAPLVVAVAWNIGAAFYEFWLGHSGWSAPMFLAFGFLATAYKLGRCPVPDDWIESSVAIERPTQGLKRTPDGAA